MLFSIEILISLLIGYIMMRFLTPAFGKLAVKLNLVDKPNHRKVHTSPVPLTGGIAILSSVFLSLLLSPDLIQTIRENSVLAATSFLLLVTGVLDDKFDLKAKYKLAIQLACAFAIAASGLRITSFYGFLGIHAIPTGFQYLLTVMVITGVVNAFNLMDGVDGLAGGLSVLGFTILGVVSFMLGDYRGVIVSVAFIGALIAFLRFNLRADKIFMGDAGSMVLGHILIVSGIKLLEIARLSPTLNFSAVFFPVVGFFCVPVLDSIRVYLLRIKKGFSPFRADRSHLHHLFLLVGFTHKKIALFINLFIVFVLLSSTLLAYFFSETFILFVVTLCFYLVTKILNMNKSLVDWKSRLTKIENE